MIKLTKKLKSYNGSRFSLPLNFFLKIWYTRFNQLNESEDIKMDILETMKCDTA